MNKVLKMTSLLDIMLNETEPKIFNRRKNFGDKVPELPKFENTSRKVQKAHELARRRKIAFLL